jgi:hypothetical protein
MRLGLLFFTMPLPAKPHIVSRRRGQSSNTPLACMILSFYPGAKPKIFSRRRVRTLEPELACRFQGVTPEHNRRFSVNEGVRAAENEDSRIRNEERTFGS